MLYVVRMVLILKERYIFMNFNPTRKLTRITAGVIALFVIMTLCFPIDLGYAETKDSYEVTPDRAFKFELNGDKKSYYVKDFIGEQIDVGIPTEYNGMPVTVIGDCAFQMSDVQSIIIPDSITFIDDYAFSYCYELKSIKFMSETLLPEFGNIPFDSVEDAVFECHISLKAELGNLIDWNLDYGCSIKTFGEETPAPGPDPVDPEITPDKAFTFVLGNDGYTVSKYLGGYKKVGIPATYNGQPVTAIGKNAFEGFRSIESVTMPDSVTSIGSWAFYDCVELKSLKMPEGLKSIGANAFQRCNAMTEFNIPASVMDIGWDAFAFCKTLKDINVNADNEYFSDEDGVLFSKDKETLIYYSSSGRDAAHYEVPKGTVSIQEDAFKMHYQDSSDSKLVTIGYPSSLKNIGDRAFKQTNLQEITVYGNIEMGSYVYDLCKNLKTVNVAEGVEILPKGMFYGVDNLENFNLPSTLRVIEDEALERYPLNDIELPEGLESIGKDAFASSKLTSVTIPSTVTKMGDRAFYNINTLTDVEFAPSSKLTTLNQYTFSGASKLENVTLPDGLTTISHGAFGSCVALDSIKLPNSMTTIGNGVFAYSGLKHASLSNSVSEIGDRTFYACSDLLTVSMPASLKQWGTQTFAYSGNLTTVYFPDNIKVNNIPYGTFIDCFSIRKIELPEQINETGVTAFLNNVNLIVEYKASILKRNPLDCSNLGIENESYYDLSEDGSYYTNRDLYFGETLLAAGAKINTQNNVTFRYVGDGLVIPAVKSVIVPEGIILDENNKDGSVKIDILAKGAKAGAKVYIKAVGKKYQDTVTGAGILALAKGENKGMFASLKTINFDYESLSKDEYEIYASLGEGSDWVKANNTIRISTITPDPIVTPQKPGMFKITSSASEGGNITASGNYNPGSTTTYFYSPDAGFKVSGLYVDGEKIAFNEYGGVYTFENIQMNHIINVEFEAIKTVEPEPKIFSVTSTASKGGTITASGSYKEGSDVKYTYKPDKGYRVSALYVNGKKISHNTAGGSYTFKDIQSHQNISVFFEVDKTVLGEGATPIKAAPKSFKVKALNKKVKLTWKRSKGVKKYQVAYKLKSSKIWKYKTISSKKNNVTIKKLKVNKNYQFKIRSYKLNGKKKVYSKWSKVKTVKIKK